jgi:membrane protease YdiL (CAAX protease family)
MTSAFIALFYGGMLALGLLIGWWAALPWPWALDAQTWSLPIQLLNGASIAAVTVILSRWASARFEWASALDEAMRKALGARTLPQIVWMALASGVGEEWLFRGALQPLIARWLDSPVAGCLLVALLFGVMHIGQPLRVYWPWTVMACVMGVVLGGVTLVSGSFIAAVVAHMLINAVNLRALTRAPAHRPPPADSEGSAPRS